MEMPKKILSVKGLAKLTGTHRTRIHDYLREGRIMPEYIDDSEHGYWSMAEAEKIAKVLEEERAVLKKGPGRRLELEGLKRRKRTPKG
jgi:hypothetical protein